MKLLALFSPFCAYEHEHPFHYEHEHPFIRNPDMSHEPRYESTFPKSGAKFYTIHTTTICAFSSTFHYFVKTVQLLLCHTKLLTNHTRKQNSPKDL